MMKKASDVQLVTIAHNDLNLPIRFIQPLLDELSTRGITINKDAHKRLQEGLRVKR